MTALEKRGRAYMLLAIVAIIGFDAANKGLLILAGTLTWGHFVLTAGLLWTWRLVWYGSRAAYGIVLFCVVLGSLYSALSRPLTAVSILFVFPITIVLALGAPATRAFAAYQRQVPADS